MIYKWKHNYTDEEKSMALTIQNLKQEIDKLVDTNEDINREFSQYKYESKKEIERLNNIIEEIEKYAGLGELNWEDNYQDIMLSGKGLLKRIKELKGSDKE